MTIDLRIRRSTVTTLSPAKRAALDAANAARTRKRLDRYADELRAAGYVVIEPGSNRRYRIEVRYADTGWTRWSDRTFTAIEMSALRDQMHGFQLSNGQTVQVGANLRFVPTTDSEESS